MGAEYRDISGSVMISPSVVASPWWEKIYRQNIFLTHGRIAPVSVGTKNACLHAEKGNRSARTTRRSRPAGAVLEDEAYRNVFGTDTPTLFSEAIFSSLLNCVLESLLKVINISFKSWSRRSPVSSVSKSRGLNVLVQRAGDSGM